MSRALPIRSCSDCPNSDHSGAFTPGGAIPICKGIAGKGEEVRYGETRPGSFGVYPNKYWSVRPMKPGTREYDGTIPEWCPLPKK